MINILNAIVEAGGLPLFVGGCVRDKIMGETPKDFDVEVYNLSSTKLAEVLSQFGKVDVVGASFGVIKLTTDTEEFDFNLPRRESKEGKGHKGFQVEVNSNLTIQEASLRRDFTINSLAEDVNGNVLNLNNGLEDLSNKILRATSTHFVEDPLRVLRGFQFSSRFGFTVEENTVKMCSSLVGEYYTLPKERVFGEWYKWAEKCTHPSLGLSFLNECGWINLYPELQKLMGCPQDPIWHPEGPVWEHTLHVVDAMCEVCKRENITGEEKVILIFSALCHDLGKPSTTIFDGRWKAPSHDVEGVKPTRDFLESIGCFPRIIEKVEKLVEFHMVHCSFRGGGNVNLKRLSNKLFPATIKELLNVIESDHSGRPPLPKGLPEICHGWEEEAEKINILKGKPKPIIMGRDLLPFNIKPGPIYKEILDRMYDKQLSGEFTTREEGLAILRSEKW